MCVLQAIIKAQKVTNLTNTIQEVKKYLIQKYTIMATEVMLKKLKFTTQKEREQSNTGDNNGYIII